jgi:hypothetical protein
VCVCVCVGVGARAGVCGCVCVRACVRRAVWSWLARATVQAPHPYLDAMW